MEEKNEKAQENTVFLLRLVILLDDYFPIAVRG